MFEFRVAEHLYMPGRKMIEVLNGEDLMADIYPTETGIKIVSKHIIDDPKGAIEIERDKLPPIPVILIHLLKVS